jgi:hypothetical protein
MDQIGNGVGLEAMKGPLPPCLRGLAIVPVGVYLVEGPEIGRLFLGPDGKCCCQTIFYEFNDSQFVPVCLRFPCMTDLVRTDGENHGKREKSDSPANNTFTDSHHII